MTGLLLAAEGSPLNHVVQHPIVEWHVEWLNLTILSNHIIMQIIAGLLLLVVIPLALRRRAGDDEIGRLVPRGLGNAIEGLCAALRTHVCEPVLGQYTDRFCPYIWSAFFFILTCNLLGIIPLGAWTPFWGHGHYLGGTATGNIWVTGTLAVCTLFMIVYSGLKTHGMAYVKHFFMGPPGLNVFIAFLEVVGLVAKTFALAVRLFANMIAGHILLAVLLSFIGMAAQALGNGPALLISIPIVLGSVAINLLEIFVAFLQAFIFTFLSAVFIGMAVNIHHDHEEHHEAHAA